MLAFFYPDMFGLLCVRGAMHACLCELMTRVCKLAGDPCSEGVLARTSIVSNDAVAIDAFMSSPSQECANPALVA